MVADEIKFIDSPQLPSTWKTAPRGWGHSLHKLSQYIGQFPPSLAHFFIRQYSQAGTQNLRMCDEQGAALSDGWNSKTEGEDFPRRCAFRADGR
jgi:hypothetical protein